MSSLTDELTDSDAPTYAHSHEPRNGPADTQTHDRLDLVERFDL
jgi:hypothetical protein